MIHVPTVAAPAGQVQGGGRTFSHLVVLLLIGLVLGHFGLAVVVDPRHDFGTGLLPQVTLDSRHDKMILFRDYNRQAPVQGLVLGSSRAMKLSPRELEKQTSRRWFNFGVDSARVEDYVAIYRWARSSGARIEAIAIGLDVEALHDSEPMDERLKTNPPLVAALEAERPTLRGRAVQSASLMKKVFSSLYLRDILRSFQVAALHPPMWSTFDADGLLHYVQWERQRAAGTFNLAAEFERSYEEYRLRFAGMQRLSASRKAQLEELIREASADHVLVVVWITPVHSKLAMFLDRETPYTARLEETRVYVRNLAREFRIPTLDFSDPAAFAATDDGWYDAAHMDEANADRVADRVATELRKNGL